jgi:hypothetical protein
MTFAGIKMGGLFFWNSHIAGIGFERGQGLVCHRFYPLKRVLNN